MTEMRLQAHYTQYCGCVCVLILKVGLHPQQIVGVQRLYITQRENLSSIVYK